MAGFLSTLLISCVPGIGACTGRGTRGRDRILLTIPLLGGGGTGGSIRACLDKGGSLTENFGTCGKSLDGGPLGVDERGASIFPVII